MEVTANNKLLFWQNNSPLSNWYPGLKIQSPWGVGNQTLVFDNSEAIFMFLKAMLFKDPETAQLIADKQDPSNVKRLGRQVKNFDQEIWDQEKEEIMYLACMMKFTRDPDMMEHLLKTNDLELVEASPYDTIWGIGLRPDDPKAPYEENWLGQNLLGKVLMRVRAEIVAEAIAQTETIMHTEKEE